MDTRGFALFPIVSGIGAILGAILAATIANGQEKGMYV